MLASLIATVQVNYSQRADGFTAIVEGTDIIVTGESHDDAVDEALRQYQPGVSFSYLGSMMDNNTRHTFCRNEKLA